jgi:hypothetical protein
MVQRSSSTDLGKQGITPALPELLAPRVKAQQQQRQLLLLLQSKGAAQHKGQNGGRGALQWLITAMPICS